MAKHKKNRFVKHKKRYPPLSKQDRLLHICIQIFGALILLFAVYGYEVLAPIFIFKNPDVLAFEERWTMLLIAPFIFTWIIFILGPAYAKIPIFGNKNIDYYNTVNYKFAFPLFDKRYRNNEKCKEARIKFFKRIIIYFIILSVLFFFGVMGCVGRHEFNSDGIATYSIFNNRLDEYSYDAVESYSVSADSYYRSRRGSSYHVYDVNLVVNLANGDSFSASYGNARNIFALEKIDILLNDKHKTVNTGYLQEFISSQSFTDDELKVLYKLFEE